MRKFADVPIGDPRVMTGFARNRKPSHGVAGISGLFIVLDVARYTSGLETRHYPGHVTGLAIELCVPPNQWESRRSMLGLHRQTFIPAIWRMTILARIAELPGMNIFMA